MYLSSAVTQNSDSSVTASVMFDLVTPRLNPFIYHLRDKDIKRSLKTHFERDGIKTYITMGLKQHC
jgi:hypothetical protein